MNSFNLGFFMFLVHLLSNFFPLRRVQQPHIKKELDSNGDRDAPPETLNPDLELKSEKDAKAE